MGVYDIIAYGEIQLQVKSTLSPGMKTYYSGDPIDLPDGLHITHEGWFIVNCGIITNIGIDIHDKWGNELKSSDIIESNNPIGQRLTALGLWEEIKAEVYYDEDDTRRTIIPSGYKNATIEVREWPNHTLAVEYKEK